MTPSESLVRDTFKAFFRADGRVRTAVALARNEAATLQGPASRTKETPLAKHK